MEQESLIQALLQAGYSEEDLEREFAVVISRYLSTEQRMPPSWVEAELSKICPLPVRLSSRDWEFLAFCTTGSIRNAMVELFGCSLDDRTGEDQPLGIEELNLREHALHEHAKEWMLYVAQQRRKADKVEASGTREERLPEEWYAGV